MTFNPFSRSALGALLLLGAGASLPACGASFRTSQVTEGELRTFAVSGSPEVALTTFNGSIRVQTWQRPEVRVVVEKRSWGRQGLEEIEIVTFQEGARVSLDVRRSRTRSRVGPAGLLREFAGLGGLGSTSASLVVSMPATSDLVARTGNGSIEAAALHGRIDLRSGNGRVAGRDLQGRLKARTGRGAVAFSDLGGEADLHSGNGSVKVDGRFDLLRVRTGNGSVSVDAADGSAMHEDWDIGTGNGRIAISLPVQFDAELDAHSGNGGVRLQNARVAVRDYEQRPNVLRATLGTGGRRLRIRTGNGSITFGHIG